MQNKEIVLITGGNGLVGNGIRSIISLSPLYLSNYDFVFISSKDCDLYNYEKCFEFFQKSNPTYVIHLAAEVGGLFKNMKYKVEMFERNMKINMNVLKASHEYKVKKVVSCLSTCIFPDQTSYPINENMINNGPPHWSNDAYAYAKRMLEVLSKSYQEEYKDNFICVIPCNVYGKYDNFSLEDGHVIPALIHQCYLAKKEGKEFIVKGTGKPLRQFIYNEDLGKLILWSLLEYKDKNSIILADEKEISIREVALLIAKEFKMEDKIIFDTSKKDGQFKKTASNEKLRIFYPSFEFMKIEEKIKEVIEWFCKNYENIRK